ncbi:MAG: hypothetical protein WBN23_16975 [Woeseia sp.]
MRDDTLFFWGMVVTMFMLIAAMLTARELIEIHFGGREDAGADTDLDADADGNEGSKTV